ncbi:hypothetical protein VTI74DRAFT_4794 [Chaetomium olivicolor]
MLFRRAITARQPRRRHRKHSNWHFPLLLSSAWRVECADVMDPIRFHDAVRPPPHNWRRAAGGRFAGVMLANQGWDRRRKRGRHSRGRLGFSVQGRHDRVVSHQASWDHRCPWLHISSRTRERDSGNCRTERESSEGMIVCSPTFSFAGRHAGDICGGAHPPPALQSLILRWLAVGGGCR